MQGVIYIEAEFRSDQPFVYEVLTAELAEIGFESFTEEDGALKAFIQEPLYAENEFDELVSRLLHKFPFSVKTQKIEPQNWNELWESNFSDIHVEDKIHVRALFHEPEPKYPIEILIQPKMSFGTGHHATTWLVMQHMLSVDFNNKKVLDFGTGTGILAILAQKLGATDVWAIDYDPQCIENSAENFELNHAEGIKLLLGDITVVEEGSFDVIIGNITRNVILEFLGEIARKVKTGGVFIASGFYLNDLDILSQAALPFNLVSKHHETRNDWCAAIFEKHQETP